jgi:hypothetical protein
VSVGDATEPPRPTLGELHRTTPWVWPWCERCQHHAPLACAVAVIRWGADASSDRLRAGARCTSCGGKGATLQRPGWAGNAIMSASIRFRAAAPTRCATRILLAHPDGRIRPHAAVSIPHRLSARPIAIWRRRHIDWRRTIVTRGGNRSPNDRSGSETAYQSSGNISAARLDWNGGSQCQRNCRWQE